MTVLETMPQRTYDDEPGLGKDCAVDDCPQRSYLRQAFQAPEGHLVTVSVCRDHNGLRDILPSATVVRSP